MFRVELGASSSASGPEQDFWSPKTASTRVLNRMYKRKCTLDLRAHNGTPLCVALKYAPTPVLLRMEE